MHCNLGSLLDDKGDLDGAEAEYLKANDIDPRHVYLHYNLGVVLKKKGDLDGAEAECLKAIEIDPQHTGALCNLGFLLRTERDQQAEAEQLFRRMIQLTPDDPNAHNNLGETLKAQGDAAGAKKAYERALSIAPRDEFALKALAELK